MSRTFTKFASPEIKDLLAALAAAETPVGAYRATMRRLGQEIGTRAVELAPEARQHDVCVLCTVEDADFLARGIVEGLAAAGVARDHIRLACFWNERLSRFEDEDEDSFDVAPIIKVYRESVDVHDAILILAKSSIRGTCVVRTNLTALLNDQVPRRVVVAAPVMMKDAPARLADQFPSTISQRFEYLAFAEDDVMDQHGNVIPGVGGSPYVRLGFIDDKNTYIPELVKERRQNFSAHSLG